MSTKACYTHEEIGKGKPGFGRTRSIIEAAFYGNNVIKVNSLKEAYELAKNSPGTVVTDMPVYKPEEMGLKKDAKVLLFNDGAVTGRYAAARRIAGEPGVDCDRLDKILMDAVYDTRWKTLYHAEVVVGLDTEFMVKAHMLIPKGEENTLYSWMLNFQCLSDKYAKMYEDSKPISGESDIYIFADPQWAGTTQIEVCDPKCLTYFNSSTNCAAILGMRYFGEYTKGTISLCWAIANRNGYISCHGGQKKFILKDGRTFTASLFGLSGTGESTITNAMHGNKYDIKILHNNSYIINAETCAAIAMEPVYYDKTVGYHADSENNKYLLTAHNCSATVDSEGKIVLVTEDIRNSNGRAIRSRMWSGDRIDKIDTPLNAVFWIIRDSTLPPVMKLKDSSLAAAMGATLATRRMTGDGQIGMVVEPYANPFRTYPLIEDYKKFRRLFKEKDVDCYMLNTGDFMGRKIELQDTLDIIESIVEGKARFIPWEPFEDIDILDNSEFTPDMEDGEYIVRLRARLNDRMSYIEGKASYKEGYDRLPEDAAGALKKLVEELG